MGLIKFQRNKKTIIIISIIGMLGLGIIKPFNVQVSENRTINTFYVSVKHQSQLSGTDLQKISSYNLVYDFRTGFTAVQLKEIHSKNPKIRVLKSINVGHVYDWMQDFDNITKNEDWFAKNKTGERVRAVQSQAYVMEPSNSGFQDWLIDQVEAYISKGYDGIMADSFYYPHFPPYSNYYASTPVSPANGQNYTAQSWMDAKNQLFKQIKNKLGTRLLIVNGYMNGRQYYKYGSGNLLKYADGVWVEAFTRWPNENARSVTDWQKDIKMLKEVASTNKYLMIQTKFIQGEENKKSNERFKLFAFSSYLLGARKNSHFELNTLDSRGWDGETIDYRHYRIKLGKPLGNHYRKGNTYQRDFTHAKIIVNPSKHTASIQMLKNSSRKNRR